MGVLGLSVGANLAVLATASGWADAGVAVSANTERLAALAGNLPIRPRGTLVLAAEADPGRLVSARALDQSGQDPKALVLLPGSAHNLALLTQYPEARKAALAWLAEQLRPAAPSAVPAAPSSERP